MELWVDEIQVIHFGQLPLGSIAHEVMTKHAVIPPLDYWNMWIWNKIASLFAVSYMEFAYRVPYMIMHTVTTTLLVISFYEILKKGSYWVDRIVLVAGFLLYFLNPFLFAYSYEIRFYAVTLLGAAVVLTLYYKHKLFSLSYYPLVLLFCLNSAFQFIILIPFLLKGIIERSTRKNALLLFGGLGVFAAIILPFLYVPQAISTIQAGEKIMRGLWWLNSLYFDTIWKQTIAILIVITLMIFRKKNAIFLIIVSIFYVLFMMTLNAKYNYRYFGAKHFMFILPFCTLVIYEVFNIMRSGLYRIGMTCVIILLFLYPFFGYLHAIKTGEWLITKAPMGLKYVFQYATSNEKNILVEFGNTSEENIEYDRLGISWYSDHYPQPVLTENINFLGCKAFNEQPSALLYSVPGVPECKYDSNVAITNIFGATIVEKY